MSLAKLEPPPRNISPLLALQAALAGPMSQIGWLLFGFGSIFFWLFAWQADLSGWRFREGAVGTVTGVSRGCRNTHYFVGGSRGRRGTPVFENRYTYVVDGNEYAGQSYDTGGCVSRGGVTVEYLLARPSYSRILGMRRRLLSPWAVLVALFPAAGLAVLLAGLWRAPFRIRALREGLPSAGRITATTPTSSRVMGRVVYQIAVEFKGYDGSVRTTRFNTTRPERLPDGQVTVLCDPVDASRGVVLEAVPGGVSVDQGRIVGSGSRAFLVLPLISFVLNGWFVYRVL